MSDRNNQFIQSMFTNMQNGKSGFLNNNPPPKLGEKSITENGTYTAKEDKLVGYSSVTADVAGGGGGDTFEVNIEYSNGNYTSDKTYYETVAAYEANKNVVFNITWESDVPVVVCSGIFDDNGAKRIAIVCKGQSCPPLLYWISDISRTETGQIMRALLGAGK